MKIVIFMTAVGLRLFEWGFIGHARSNYIDTIYLLDTFHTYGSGGGVIYFTVLSILM